MMCVNIVLMCSKENNLSGQILFKDHRWKIAEIIWILVSEKKNIKNKGKLHLHHNKSFQTLFKKQIICSHAKTNSTILIYHTGTSARTGFYCHMKWELFFLELEHIKGLVHTGIKKVPHVHI